jgi:hypothetical protein
MFKGKVDARKGNEAGGVYERIAGMWRKNERESRSYEGVEMGML